MSSAFVERPLLIFPSLAATIGLDAALLYQLLSDWQPLLEGKQNQGATWHLLDRQRLQDQLPFWNSQQIFTTLRTLNDQGLIVIGGALNDNVQNIRFSLPSRQEEPPRAPSKPAAVAPTLSSNRAPVINPVPGHSVMSSHWRPDQASVDYLRRFNQVPEDFIDSLLPEFIQNAIERGETRSSWNSAFSQYVSKRWKKAQYDKIEADRNQSIDDSWQPNLDALEILKRDNITQNFIEDAIPEFILYWRERGSLQSNWNSRFIQHVRLQWARFNNTVNNENEIAPITANWQPSDAVFDIIHMARIDESFAREQVPEFILFWQDSGQAHRSWNTKFLQHVKYRWANSHQLGQSDARQQQASTASGKTTSFIDKHTDRSWREGL
ncbi:MAG: DnaT-like ssDNA-binding domain-containing protein [Spongiibacteraceae bacterium]